MAKARKNLKGVGRAVDRLTKDLKDLQKKPGIQASQSEAAVLSRKLTRMKTLLDGCPEPMFNMFTFAEPTARTTARRAKTAKKSTRKGTRKRR